MTVRSWPFWLALVLVLGCAGVTWMLVTDGQDEGVPGVGPGPAPDPVRDPTGVSGPGESTRPGPPADPVPDRPPSTGPAGPSLDPGGSVAPAAPTPDAAPTVEGGRVTGRVVATGGQPVAGAEVQLARFERKALGLVVRGAVCASGTTDEQGRFTLTGVRPGHDYGLVVRHDDHPEASREPVVVSAGATTDLGSVELEAGAAAFGRVIRGDNGRPVAGVEVRIVDRVLPEAFGGRKRITTRTAADGTFRLANLRPGPVRLEAEASEFAPARRELTLEPGREVGPLEVILRDGESLAGEVVDDQGRLIPGVRVLAAGDQHAVDGRTDEQGRFEIRHLRAGLYRLVCQKRGYGTPQGAASQRDFAAGTRGIRLVLERRAGVAGQVVDAKSGQPVPDFTVVWGPSDRELDHSRTFQAEDGRFVLASVQPGPVVIEVRSPQHASRRLPEMTLRAGDRIEGLEVALLQGGSVRGRVVRRSAGTPLAGVVVMATVPGTEKAAVVFGGEAVNPPQPVRSVTTGPDGRFTLENLAGRYLVRFRKNGLAPRDLGPVSFAAGEDRDLSDVELGEGGTITGFVPGPDGRGDADAEVWIHGESGFNRSVRTDRTGRFALHFVPPGTYRATLTRRDGKLALEDLIQMARQGGRSVTVTEGGVSVVRF